MTDEQEYSDKAISYLEDLRKSDRDTVMRMLAELRTKRVMVRKSSKKSSTKQRSVEKQIEALGDDFLKELQKKGLMPK